ncbi:MAG: glycosyl transferase group 1 [Frankiales bacterium]|nr:glycosyl transferase group 1 [Frankiales bacterium]
MGCGPAQLRVALDATPLAGERTGIGRYVEHLLDELAVTEGVSVRAAAFTLRGRSVLSALPDGVRGVHRPVPARLLHRSWLRSDLPPAEWVMGRADVVHGTNFVLPPPRRAAGVLTVHDLSYLRFPELVDRASLDYRTLVPRAVSRAAVVLTPSQAIADEVSQAYGLPADRVHATPLGVDPSWFDTSAITALPGLPAEYLLAVGTLEPRKGLDVLLAAYRQLSRANRDLPPLVLVGPAGWGPALETFEIPPDRLIVPGYVDTAVLQALVSGALMLAFPSRYEGFGLPPLEALAAGTPVVASDIPAVTEVIGAAQRMTTLVPVGDVEALAAAVLARLSGPPSAADRISGQQHAAAFTWQRCAERTVAGYRFAVG